MLPGQCVTVHMDHKNLIHPSTKFSSNQVLRQQLTLEEYGITLQYIKSTKIFVADILSRLPFTETAKYKEEINVLEPGVIFKLKW